jgi:hypothetical protein
MPKSKAELPQATITETTQSVKVIADPQQVDLGLNGHLWHDGKQILVYKGYQDGTAVAAQVYHRLSQETDLNKKPFTFSKHRRGLVHSDPVWKSPKKVSGLELLDYLARWFIPCQLLTNANGQALVIVDEFPKLFAAQLMQPRYGALFADLFTWID